MGDLEVKNIFQKDNYMIYTDHLYKRESIYEPIKWSVLNNLKESLPIWESAKCKLNSSIIFFGC